MKRLIGVLLGVLFIVGVAWGAATMTQSYTDLGNVTRCSLTWTAHTTGAVAGLSTRQDITGWILRVETDPAASTPQPDDGYTLVINNADGLNIMGQTLTCDETNNETWMPLVNGNYTVYYNEGPLTPVIASAGSGKQGTIDIYYIQDK